MERTSVLRKLHQGECYLKVSEFKDNICKRICHHDLSKPQSGHTDGQVLERGRHLWTLNETKLDRNKIFGVNKTQKKLKGCFFRIQVTATEILVLTPPYLLLAAKAL